MKAPLRSGCLAALLGGGLVLAAPAAVATGAPPPPEAAPPPRATLPADPADPVAAAADPADPADPVAADSAAAPAEPRIAALAPAASKARIVVEMRLAGEVRGRFEHIEGELVALPDGRCVVRVRLDARRLHLDGPSWRVRMTRSEHFLDVENHPDIRFVSAPFERALLRTGGRLDGALRLRGRERPVTFALAPSDCPVAGPGCGLHVSGQISRREFGMVAYRLWVQDGVAFDFKVRLRQPDTP